MDTIKIWSMNTIERKRLEDFASTLRLITGDHFEVGTTYFDYGQDWKWATIISKDAGYQVLNPREHELIVTGHADECLDLIVESYFKIRTNVLEAKKKLLERKRDAWKDGHKVVGGGDPV